MDCRNSIRKQLLDLYYDKGVGNYASVRTLTGWTQKCLIIFACCTDYGHDSINGDGFARPLARKTATNARSVLRQALKAAERDELVVRNVAALSDLPALHQGDDSDTAGISEEEILSPTDVNRLIEWLHAAHKAGTTCDNHFFTYPEAHAFPFKPYMVLRTNSISASTIIWTNC